MTISLGQSQTPAAGPTIPPARNAWDVLSQYGSTYTNQAGVIFDSFGGSNIVGDVTLGDLSVVKKYTSHSYSGISTNGALSLNVSAMTHLHIDVWSPDFVSFKIKLEAVNGSNVELEVPFTKTQSSWNSYDLDLSTYSAVDLANLRWIVPVTFGPNNTTLFITNVYFYRPATLLPPTVGPFTVAPQSVGSPDFTLTPPTSNNTSPFTYMSSNMSVATIVSGNQLHIVGGGSSTITASQVSDGTYGPSSATATFVASYPAPGPSPIPPARAPGTVVSMFTGTPPVYANVVNAIRAPWTAGTTLTTIANGADTCLQVDNFGYLGYITDGANFSAAGMTKLHVDIYLNTPIANMFIFLLSNGDQLYNTGALVAGWNSLDISLGSAYPGANLADIYGFKFEHNQGAARQIYLDNIYFYVAGSDPTITDFTVPAKIFGDADFALTAPTSNSAGAFSYTSTNMSVATIVNGNEIHITGIGTSTITANQAANGSFDAGSITASFVVSAPPLATAAPTPPVRNAYDVVSLYSNAYTNLPSATWVGASTLTDEVLEGNDTKKMSNFIVEFINFAATDVSQMTTLHMDIYTPDCPGFNIWLLNNGDRNAQIFPAVNGWRSLDIPLSTYVNNGLNMTALIQLKFEGLFGPGKTAYVDNVYFYRAATLPPATVGTFTVPAKNVGDANFALTPPTSNNTSPFTYTSSNNSIATIVGGNQIQIGTGGTCTITASQVSDGTYGPTSRTATFVVSFPAPGASPIPPVRTPSRVISMYTGTPSVYTTTPNYSLGRAFWTAGATLTEIPNGTNTALRADNLGYIGLIDTVSERRLNVTGMTNLHLDVYVNAPFANLFFWLLTDGDQRRDLVNLTTGWNSINIPLSEFGGANLANVYGLKFEQNTPNALQIYLDNIYFSDDTHYADVDGDGYGDLASPVVGEPIGSVLDNTDCNDNNPAINPGHAEVCYNNIDDNCNATLSEGCAAVPVNMIPSYNGTTLPSFASAIPAVAYTYPGATNIKYRYSITNTTTGVTSADIIQTSRFVTIPAALHSSPGVYTIKVSAVINDEVVAYAGNTITVNAPVIPMITLAPGSCGATIASLASTLTANAGLNTTGYTFRIRLTSDNGPTPDYHTSSSPTRFVSANSFAGFPLSYATSYKLSVQYTYTDPVTSLPTDSGYGAECTVITPSIPLTGLASPTCGSQVATLNANISATSASYATAYQFRIRVTSDNGPMPTYYYSLPNASRFSSLTAFQGITYAYNTQYSISVQYSIVNNSATVWSGYGTECIVKTPFFPVTSLVPSQCGLPTATSLTQQLNITPYPGFPNYKVKLDEISGEVVVNTQEIVVTYSNFRLNHFSIAQLGKNYNVSVAIKQNGVFGDYSTACDLFTAAVPRTIKMPFKATAYPNPFANNFMLDVKTTSQSAVSLKVYDMLGRLIDQRDVRVSDLETATIGDSYPSGIYNVVVSQEESIQTVRVVKR